MLAMLADLAFFVFRIQFYFLVYIMTYISYFNT